MNIKIGNTPMIKIKYRYNGKEDFIYTKLESYNITGSIKDRVAYYIIKEAYALYSKANLKKGLYDNYIRAFRWATDRIEENGIISFITNGSFIDNQGMDGFRKCIFDEFSSVYIFNLRGNQRTSGELSKKEGGKIFGSGSRTPVSITCLIKNNSKEHDGYIHYYDIGDYLNREQKLIKIKKLKDISQIEWEKIIPDSNNDWINVRNDNYLKFDYIVPEDKENPNTESIFTKNVIGIATNRDAWAYNYSIKKLERNMLKFIENYNIERIRTKGDILKLNNDSSLISWSEGLRKKIKNNIELKYESDSIKTIMYRPFCKNYLYYDNNLVERPGKSKEMSEYKIIATSGIGGNKGFSAIMLNSYADLNMMEAGTQCYPYEWFKDGIRKDGISDKFCEKIQNLYSRTINKEKIFYYIYGILHSNQYKNTFFADLKKDFPRIPIINNYEDFLMIENAGKKLADLHLNYEKIEPYKKCKVIKNKENYKVIKMKFGKNKDKSIIEYNDNIIIKNIPLKAYEYVVNGKSAIEWIMERYAITTDKRSGIVNDPNDWCEEVGDEKYIFNLLLRIINVSIKTMDIINSLPNLNFDE